MCVGVSSPKIPDPPPQPDPPPIPQPPPPPDPDPQLSPKTKKRSQKQRRRGLSELTIERPSSLNTLSKGSGTGVKIPNA